MARKHAQVLTSIWRDDEFIALTGRAQRMYLFLLSQPDLSLAGVLIARPRVWASKCAGSSVELIEDALEELDAQGFVTWDREVDEVLLRSFHKHNVAGSPKAIIGASRALGAVASPVIRAQIVAAVHPEIRDEFAQGLDSIDFREFRERCGSLSQVDTPYEGVSHGVSDRASEGVSPTETGDRRPDTGYEIPESPASTTTNLLVVETDDPAVRETALLIGQALAIGARRPAAYAATVAGRINTGDDPADRDRIAAELRSGKSPAQIAQGWTDADRSGPGEVSAEGARLAAHRREAETRDRLLAARTTDDGDPLIGLRAVRGALRSGTVA